jgi:2-(1,2-epoxy-1,2-dihydrophenyl)acetyl-CoA isomerase
MTDLGHQEDGSKRPRRRVVLYEPSNGIATITLNRPERLNAVVPELVDQLCEALQRATSERVGAAVLIGAGRAFCAGHDLKEPDGGVSEKGRRARLDRMQEVTQLVREAPFPVIAGVHGYALGAGCEFALCCDLVVAARSAVFGFPEVSVGLGITGGVSHVLPLAVGLAKAKELVLVGDHFGATSAAQLGLVNYLVDDGQLGSCVRALAERLRDRPRLALTLAKKALDQGAASGIEAAYEVEVGNALVLHGTEDARRATAAFRQRSRHRRQTGEASGDLG